MLTYTLKENTQAIVVRFRREQLGRIYRSAEGWRYIPNGLPMDFNAEVFEDLDVLKKYLEGESYV